jgi:flagella basal body P-ring formation protein FlgA
VTAGRVVAIRDLPAGQAIPADAVAIQASEAIPDAMDWAVSIEQVAGQWPRGLVHAGTALRLNQLTKALDVERGDTVQVDAESGNAHLEFEARAEGSGAMGDRISVTNPMSQRRFMARVAGKGRVSVDGSAAHDKP